MEGVSETIVWFDVVVTEGFKMKSYLFPDTVKQNNKKIMQEVKPPQRQQYVSVCVCVGGGVELLYLHTILILN